MSFCPASPIGCRHRLFLHCFQICQTKCPLFYSVVATALIFSTFCHFAFAASRQLYHFLHYREIFIKHPMANNVHKVCIKAILYKSFCFVLFLPPFSPDIAPFTKYLVLYLAVQVLVICKKVCLPICLSAVLCAICCVRRATLVPKKACLGSN